MHTPRHSPPADERPLRILSVAVRMPDGARIALQVPSDRTAYDLEPLLAAATGLDERTVLADTPDGTDVTDVALGEALRSPENPTGSEAVTVRVAGEGRELVFTLECAGVAEPQPHHAYPRALDPQAEPLVQAYRQEQEDDWFCDGSSTLSCCEAARNAPETLPWVAV